MPQIICFYGLLQESNAGKLIYKVRAFVTLLLKTMYVINS